MKKARRKPGFLLRRNDQQVGRPAGRVADAEPVAEVPAEPDGAMPPGVGLVEPEAALPVVLDDALPDWPPDVLLRKLLVAISQHCVAREPAAPGAGEVGEPELWA